MKPIGCDVAVIGGGPSGLAAAVAATEAGADTLLLERHVELGGVLPQCIHPGFGLKLYGEELTGPEYSHRWIARMGDIRRLTDTMVVSVSSGFSIWATGPQAGLTEIRARSLVLAMGCRERTRGAIAIPGTRPAGVMTAGTAQRLVNVHGRLPGRRFAILGSGDIGMIMARRLTWEGAEVVGMYELLPYLAGLRRNYVQCLQDFDIPLHLGHTVTEIHGDRRLTGVTVCQVDDASCPMPSTAQFVAADTLLLSVGLIPENELTKGLGAEMDPVTGGPLVDDQMETSVPGLFAAGNVVQVHDLADDVSLAGGTAGRAAADHALGRVGAAEWARVAAGAGVRSVVPQRLRLPAAPGTEITLRVRRPVEGRCHLVLMVDGEARGRRRLDYARPGEMASIALGERAAAALRRGSEVVVEVTEA